MVPHRSRRRVLRAAGSTLAVALAGCGRLSGRSTPRIESTLGTTAHEPVLEGQPTPEDGVPAVWGVLFAHPDAARKLVDWRALVPEASTVVPGAEFRTFDPDERFASVVVGVLPTGYGLRGYRPEADSPIGDFVSDFRERPAFEDGRLRLEVTPFRAFAPDADAPAAHYDYTFTLWDLNGGDRPDDIAIEFHPAEPDDR